jgi:alpha-beta hydrolase superfamily lysophospholipase
MPPFDAAIDTAFVTSSEPAPARSLWFGNPDAPLFGWFHSAGARPLDAVVVMCSPFGYEAHKTHYGYKKLAQQLSRAGIATLRFDYAGTGDSSGDDDTPEQLAAWLASIGTAIAEAKRQSGASKVILFGARLGALLATVHAQENPVDGIVMFGPPRSGSTYIRELRAFNGIRTANPGEDASPDIEFPEDENTGYALSDELRAAISGLDPRETNAPPAPRALVIARDDVPGPEVRLVEHLRSLGVEVAHSHAPGFTELYDYRMVPPETVSEMLSWMRVIAAHPRREYPAASGAESPIATFHGVTEETVRFQGLFGIVTEPGESTTPRETGILLLGTGAHPHTGVSRMSVTLARSLAKLGFRVLRFDLSGIGESPVFPGQGERELYTTQAVPETQAAIDFMMSRGCKNVALLGLCSGGYTAFHTAVVDPRVVAILPINILGFHLNPADSLSLATNGPGLLRNRMRPSALIARYLGLPVERSGHRGPAPRTLPLLRDRDPVARGFGTLLAHRCRTLLVYGSASPGRRILAEHLGPWAAKAKDEEGFEMVVVHGTDHTFTPRVAQRQLYSLATEFFDRGLA